MSASLTFILLIILATGFLGLATYIYLAKKKETRLARGQFFMSGCGPIHYQVLGGRGPDLLFIHGLGASSYCWRNVAQALAKQHRVILLDLWGFGFSSKALDRPMGLDEQIEVLVELLDHIKVKHCHVVGHSMGGQLALWLAISHPARVDRLVAISPATYPNLVSDTLKRFTWLANWTPLLISPVLIRRTLVGMVHNPKQITQEVVENYFYPYKDPQAHRSFAAALDIIRDLRVFDNLSKVKSPVLLIWGEKDRVVRPKALIEIRNRIPSSQTVTHEGFGHLLMEDDPVWLTEQIKSFLLDPTH